MFIPLQSGATRALLQGDLVRQVPLPFMGGAGERIVYTGKVRALTECPVPPTADHCNDEKPKAMMLSMSTANVLILSQSCNLERIGRGDNRGRIIVAPVLDEDVEAPEVREAALQALEESFSRPGQNAEQKVQAERQKHEKTKLEQLKKIWLGKVGNIFPVAKLNVEHFTAVRSLCYFDNLVSLPATWYPLLSARVVANMTDPWRSLLQEALSDYFGRFAYPGSENDRLAVGGLQSPNPDDPPKDG